MKRKLSLFVAGVMMLSMLPAMSVFATTKNDVPIISSSVGTDTTFKYNEGNAPALFVNAVDYPESLNQNTKFVVSLTNAEWDLSDYSVLTPAAAPITSSGAITGGYGGTLNNGVTFVMGGDSFTNMSTAYTNAGLVAGDFNQAYPATKGTMLVKAGASLLGKYTPVNRNYLINFMDSTTAEVVIGNNQAAHLTGTATNVYVPMIVKMKGAGAGSVTVSDSAGSGVSTSTVTFATANEGSVIITSSDNKKKTANRLVLADIKIDETVTGKIPMGPTDANLPNTKYIELVAPSGFLWDTTNLGNGVGKAKASLYGGFNSGDVLYFNTTGVPIVANTPSSTTTSLVLPLAQALNGKSTTARGQMTISGPTLVKDGASLGEIKVRVTVPNAGTTYLTVGELTKKNISLDVDTTKEMPQIVNGVYSKDSTDQTTRVLEVTVKEGVIGAWPLGTGEDSDFVLTLGDDVKFRGIEFKKIAGLKGAQTNTITLNNYTAAQTNVSTATGLTNGQANTGTLKLEAKKFTVNGFARTSNTDAVELQMKVYVTVKPGYTGDITLSTHEDSQIGAGLTAKVGTAINAFEVKATPTKLELGAMSLKVNDFTIVENVAGGLKVTGNDSYYGGDSTTGSGTVKDSYQDVWMWLGLSGENFGFGTEGLKAEVVSGDISIDSIKAVPLYGGSSSVYTTAANAIKLKVKHSSSTPSTVKISGATVTTNRYLPSGNVELRFGGSAVANSNYKPNGKSLVSTLDSDKQGSFDENYIVAVKDFLTIDGTGSTPGATGSYTAKVSVKIGSTTMTVNGESKPVSQPAFKKGGVTYVPARATCVALGFRDDQFNYDWTTKTVTIFGTPRGTAQFTVGSEYININGTQQVTMGYGATAQGHNGTTFLPFRALGEIVMNVPVDWDDATQTAYYNK